MPSQENLNRVKDQVKKREVQTGKDEERKPQKSKNDYMRIGILVAIILVAAVVAAIYVDSPKSCSGVVFSVQRNDCFASAAVATGNSTMCYGISSQQLQESCLENVAYATKNVSLCASIKNAEIAYACDSNLSITTGNETVCTDMQNSSLKSECLYSFAKSRNFSDVSYCSGISNSTLYGYCTGSSSYVHAMKTGNPSYCSVMDNIPNVGVPTADLLESLPSNQSSKLSASSIILLNASNADVCYYSVAVAYGNISICGDIYGSIATACEYYVNSTIMPKRILNLSTVISKCNEAGIYGGSATTNACFIGFAVSYDNVSYCSPITNASIESTCVSEVSSRPANSST
ncbi:MAG: hypothetical protein QXR73_00720 [Candidatus Micrarchaeaceae archaeon]